MAENMPPCATLHMHRESLSAMICFRSPHTMLAAAALALTLPCLIQHADAAPSETGLHKIHAVARSAGKLCMVDHFHEQDGLSFPSRHVAEASAIRQWVTFTADEYGTAWGGFAAAGSKKVDCKQGPDKYWSCSALACPCKSGK